MGRKAAAGRRKSTFSQKQEVITMALRASMKNLGYMGQKTVKWRDSSDTIYLKRHKPYKYQEASLVFRTATSASFWANRRGYNGFIKRTPIGYTFHRKVSVK